MITIQFQINQPKTWILDVDGVIFVHNSHLSGEDVPVEGIHKFLKNISKDDYVLLLTAREDKYRNRTVDSLKRHKIRFNEILFGLPKGERILINDSKPDGQHTAYAVNSERNKVADVIIERHETSVD